ncbi:hypothetical protein QOZ80_9AG0692990 [Eleusine coracana subsp. coracana]|nr:hypothetical protein QOZ80_9AG0692990 [Eleusine coracana subsp. coracana]
MDLVTGAMGMLPSKLLELLKKEYQLQKGVREDVKFLSRELESMYTALRKVAMVPWEQLDDQVKVWAREVREASYEMEDVLDTFIIRAGSGPEPAHMVQRLMKKMGKLFDLSKVMARRDIAAAIEGIKLQLQEMSDRRDRYKVDGIVVHPSAAANVDPRLSHLYIKESQLVGIDEPREELIKMLSIQPDSHISDGKEMKIVSVVGLGGLGKTTLAKAVYDKVNLQFDCRAFIPVGQNPDPRKVLRDILIDIENNNKTNIIFDIEKTRSALVDLMQLDERQLINELREHLKGKRYLIVIDDIWETSIWETIKNAFIDDNFGSRVIATTRISHVSREIGEVYSISELSDNNSKELFFRRIFPGEDKRPRSVELDEVSDKLLRRCHGVPLAIVTIASVLARKPLEEWSGVYNSIGFGPDGDEHVENMKKILSFSYYDLPCHLRTCLLYLSIFPEEIAIERRDLILRWIAEGFVKEEKGREIFDTGDSYLHELINRNLVIPIKEEGSGLLFACRLHDMVLHLIRDLSCRENFVVVLNGEQQPPGQDNIRRLAFHQLLKVETNYGDMPQLRSFEAIMCHTSLMPSVCSFKVLRVLVLVFCIGMEGYPLDHIAKLIHLRYLELAHTPVRKLPKDIGRLKFLQTLLLNDTGIEELPASVCQLRQLMCLRVDRKISVPKWIGKLTSLVELEMYHEVFDSYDEEPFSVVGPEMYHGVGNKCSTRQFVKELGKLTKLRVLMTGMTLQDEEQGREFLESLRKLHKIQSINISLPNGFLPMDVNKMEPKFVLSSNLRVLDLFNLQFSKLPAWINAQNLPNLCHLTVVVFDEDEQDLAVLGKFIRLRKLALAVIRVHRLKLAACGSVGFQNLTSFEVTVPLKFAHGAMPSLEYINFSIPVAELKDVGINLEFGLENLSSLRSVHVNIDCADACEMEVNDAEAVLKNAMDIHPNHPACEVKKTGENKMGPADALSRMENRQCHKIVKASTLSADINVQQELHNALYNEAADVARSMPKEHPCVAKLALLPKNLAGDPVGSLDRACELLAMDQLIEKMETQERLLEEYNVEIPRMATILEELKTALSLQAEDDGVCKICDLVAEGLTSLSGQP